MTAHRSPAPDPAAAAARRRQRGIKLALIVVSLALGLAVAELAVRLLAPQTALAGLDFLVADPEVGWRLQPNVDRRMSNQREFDISVRTDALGLRVGERPAPAGAPLLALGDSYVFGWGVEADDPLFARVGAALGWPVANAGVPGYGPCQAADFGLRLAAKLAPRAAALAVFLGNDERNAASGLGTWEIRDGALAAPGWRPSRLRPLTHPLFQSSHLLRLARFSPAARWVERRVLGRQPQDLGAALREILMALEPGPPAEIAAGDAALARCLPAARDAFAARGVPLLVVLLPDWSQVDPARLAADAAVIGARELDPAAPGRRLAEMLARAGIAFVDLRPPLAAAIAQGERIYFEIDRHFTPLGHQRAAEALVEPVRALVAAPPAAPGA